MVTEGGRSWDQCELIAFHVIVDVRDKSRKEELPSFPRVVSGFPELGVVRDLSNQNASARLKSLRTLCYNYLLVLYFPVTISRSVWGVDLGRLHRASPS